MNINQLDLNLGFVCNVQECNLHWHTQECNYMCLYDHEVNKESDVEEEINQNTSAVKYTNR